MKKKAKTNKRRTSPKYTHAMRTWMNQHIKNFIRKKDGKVDWKDCAKVVLSTSETKGYIPIWILDDLKKTKSMARLKKWLVNLSYHERYRKKEKKDEDDEEEDEPVFCDDEEEDSYAESTNWKIIVDEEEVSAESDLEALAIFALGSDLAQEGRFKFEPRPKILDLSAPSSPRQGLQS